jgi:FolB domain-containing protein
MEKKIVEVKIKELRLRTIIGINEWERQQKQDVVISLSYKYDAAKAIKSDDVKQAVDYKTLTKKIICEVEASKFNLLETLTDMVYSILSANKNLFDIDVVVEKPGALRYTDNVLIKIASMRLND